MSRRLSPPIARLVACLDEVIEATSAGECTENEAMAAHVRCVLNDERNGEPLFTEDVLKLAFIELISLEGE
jgi:hypothetical protein